MRQPVAECHAKPLNILRLEIPTVDKTGKRIAYGTGPVVQGNIDVSSTSF